MCIVESVGYQPLACDSINIIFSEVNCHLRDWSFTIVNLLLPRELQWNESSQVYVVDYDKAPTDAQIASMRDGVVITTTSQRSNARPVTAKTLPCKVTRIGAADSRWVTQTLCACTVDYLFPRSARLSNQRPSIVLNKSEWSLLMLFKPWIDWLISL